MIPAATVKNLPIFFKLIINASSVDIVIFPQHLGDPIQIIKSTREVHYFKEEPVNWDKVNVIVKRDPNYFGVNYQYTDGSVQLEFYADCLGDVIRDVFEGDGSDGDITLQYGYLDGVLEIVDFEGKLDLNTYTRTFKGNVSCTINTTGFHTLLNSRMESTVDLFDRNTLDGVLKSSYPAIDLKLHSKLIKRQTICLGGISSYKTGSNEDDQASDMYFTLLFPEAEDTGNQAVEFGGDGLAIDSRNIGLDLIFLATMSDSGSFLFVFDLYFELYAELSAKVPGRAPSFETWNLELLMRHYDEAGTFKKEVTCWVDVDSSNKINGKGTARKSYHAVFEIEDASMVKGDKVSFYGHLGIDGAGDWTELFCSIRTHQPYPDRVPMLTITAMTAEPDTNSKAFMVHEAIQNIVESITGNKNCVKSDYFGRVDIGYPKTGDGGLYAIANGFMIRNFFNVDGTPKRQLKTSFRELMSSLRSIFGIGVGYEYDNRGNQIIRIEPIDYFYQDNEILTITDCAEYREEVMKENVFNEVLIGYKKYPEPSYSGDDTKKAGYGLLDEFLTQLDFNTPIKTNKQKLELLSDLIASGFAIEETRRAQFSSDKNNSTTYDDSNFIISVVKTGSTWRSEKGKDAFTYDNIISGDSAYNMRISPKRNLLRWASWINSGLAFCKATDILKNASFVMNGFLTSKKIGESTSVTEKSSIVLADYGNKNHFAKPISISFKCRLDIDAIRIIKDAYTGKSTQKNGYISVMNDENEMVSGYLYDMTYSPVTEQVTLKLMKRDSINNEGCDCNSFANWTFSDFETRVVPDAIEDCIFANFN